MSEHVGSTGADEQLRRALASLREMRGRLETLGNARTEPIAIVGLGCRFPAADGPDQYWDLLRRGGDAVRETPPDRWPVDEVFDPAPDASGKVATRWGGFVEGIDLFDAAFFGIAPREAARMDPQQRLLLEVAWEALEDAGQDVNALAGTDTGVFVGVHSHSSDYYLLQAADRRELDLYSGTGTSHSVASGRLSYVFDWRGPSIAVDTACSSSLVAVHLAVRSLRNRECSVALVGGVNAMIEPTFTMVASRMRMMSPTGRCRPFDAGGDGFVRSEGCAAVVLKRLSDAEASGDRVLAVIRGSAVNQDGRSNGLTAPNSASQRDVIRAALEDGRTAPDEVGMIEAHGTGTPLGDPIEVEALAEVFGTRSDAPSSCSIGSAKANIGHCEGAAGLAGLIKAVLTLRAGEIPPLVHFDTLNPHISLDGTPLRITTELEPWPGGDRPRVAGVSSFGWSGTNAHVIVAEAPTARPAEPVPERAVSGAPFLLPFSARGDTSLSALAAEYRRLVDDADNVETAALCVAAAMRRSHLEQRVAVVGRSRAELVEHLDAFLAGQDRREVAVGAVPPSGPAPTVFVCPGQGTQWVGMARRLIDVEPAFTEAIERCEEAFAPFVDWSLSDVLSGTPATADRLDDIDVVQPTLFGVQVALAALWRSYGVEPDAVVGHSMGEVAAAHIAGVLTLDDAARVICWRSRLLRRISGRGAMAVVGLDAEAARRAIVGLDDRLALAVVNATTSTVVSGDPDALDELEAGLQADDVFVRRIKVDVASHSPQVDELLDDLLVELRDIVVRPARIPVYSTVSAAVEDRLDAAYWARNMRDPVRFADAVGSLIADGFRNFVELSPHPALVAAVEQTLVEHDVEGVTVATMYREADETVTFRSALASLYASGHPVDWKAYHREADSIVPLPRYPWSRERHWLEPSEPDPLGRRGSRDDAVLGWRVPLAPGPVSIVWENVLERADRPALFDRVEDGDTVLPPAALLDLLIGAAHDGCGACDLVDVRLEPHVVVDPDRPTAIQVVADPAFGGRVEVHRSEGTGWVRIAEATIVEPSETDRIGDVGGDAGDDPHDPVEVLSSANVDLGERLQVLGQVAGDGVTLTADVAAAADGAGASTWCEPAVQAAEVLSALAARTSGRSVGVPVGVRRVARRAADADRSQCVARVRGDAGDAPLVDVRCTDAVRREVVELVGVEFADHRSAVGAHDLFHVVEWRAADDEPTASEPDLAVPWLILADDAGYADALASRLETLGVTCTTVAAGHGDPNAPERRSIRPGDRDALAALLDEVGERAEQGFEVVSMWPLDAPRASQLTDADLVAAQHLGCGTLLDLVQSLPATVRCRVRVVTSDVNVVVPGDGAEGIAQSPLWGFGRALAEEVPDVWGGIIDLDPDEALDDSVDHLVTALLDAEPPPELALRDGGRYVPRLAPQTVEPGRPVRFRPDETVLVTGGFGAVGRELCEWLVAHGARRLLLVGRTPLPPRGEWSGLDPDTPAGRRAGVVRRLEALGASVHVGAVDVGDAPALRRFLDDFETEGWPPIRSVFHAAAVFGGDLVDALSPSTLSEQLAPKVAGTHVLADALDLDRLMLFSSIAAVLPMPGQNAYAAANSFLDAFAARLEGGSTRVVSVDWGYWLGTSDVLAGESGQTAGPDGTAFKDTANQLAMSHGMYGFTVSEGLDALGRVLSDERVTSSIVVPVDWSEFAAARAARPLALAGDVVASIDARSETGGDPTAAVAHTTLADRLHEAAPGDRPDLAQDGVRRIVAGVLKMAESRVGDLQPFGALGLDSLMAIELRNELERATRLKLSATVAWNYPTVRELGAYILGRLGLGPVTEGSGEPRSSSDESSAPADDSLRDLAEMSDEAALSALLDGEGT